MTNDVGTYDDGHDAGPVDGFIDVIASLFGHRRGGGRIRFGALHGALSAYEILEEWSVEITLPCLFTNRDAP